MKNIMVVLTQCMYINAVGTVSTSLSCVGQQLPRWYPLSTHVHCEASVTVGTDVEDRGKTKITSSGGSVASLGKPVSLRHCCGHRKRSASNVACSRQFIWPSQRG